MSATDQERLATLEAEMKNIKADVADIKDSLKALEKIAERGGGAFHAVLMVGGLIGYIVGIGTTLYALIRPH